MEKTFTIHSSHLGIAGEATTAQLLRAIKDTRQSGGVLRVIVTDWQDGKGVLKTHRPPDEAA